MDTSVEAMKVCLSEARELHAAGDLELSLEKFEYFFEHALDSNPAALYGVRLSFCLAYWRALADDFPKAGVALEDRLSRSLANFRATGDPLMFHEFASFCEYLGRRAEAAEEFMSVHVSNRDLAERLYSLVEEDLIAAGKWHACSEHTPDAMHSYASILADYDHLIEFERSRGNEHETYAAPEIFAKAVSNLLLVLTNAGRGGEARRIRTSLPVDLKQRGMESLEHRILGEGAP